MENRAQSALEYLMTYGWALIVIAIVIGVLILVTSSATGSVTCQSSTTSLVLKESSISSTQGVGLSIMNATAGNISALSVGSSNAKITGTAVTKVAGVNATAVNKNDIFTITGLAVTAGNLNNAIIDVNYTTETGLPASAAISCSGTVA